MKQWYGISIDDGCLITEFAIFAASPADALEEALNDFSNPVVHTEIFESSSPEAIEAIFEARMHADCKHVR